MNDEQKQELGHWLENHTGVGGISRSEKPPTPVTPPAGAGVSPPGEPRGGSPEAADEPIWAEVEPSPENEVEGAEASVQESLPWDDTPPAPVRKTRRRGTLKPGAERPALPLSPQQKLLLLDTWLRSGLPARDFGALVNVSRQTLYAWKKRFEELGPAGLIDQPKGAKLGSKLPERPPV